MNGSIEIRRMRFFSLTFFSFLTAVHAGRHAGRLRVNIQPKWKEVKPPAGTMDDRMKGQVCEKRLTCTLNIVLVSPPHAPPSNVLFGLPPPSPDSPPATSPPTTRQDVVTCKLKECEPMCVCQKIVWSLEFNPALRESPTKTVRTRTTILYSCLFNWCWSVYEIGRRDHCSTDARCY